jgi:hypothetical protein
MKSPEVIIVEARIAMIEKILGTSFDQGLKDELEMRKVQLERMKFLEFKENHVDVCGVLHTKCKAHKCDAYLNGDCTPELVEE